jgi:hypothetical protein
MESTTTCTTATDCEACASGGCFWHSTLQKCSTTPEPGYKAQCNEDQLIRFNAGRQYANKVIQTSDRKFGYVTATGVLKQFLDGSAVRKTLGKNGCPNGVETVNQAWDKLGYAAGSTMLPGQSCGQEAAYIAAAPPENAFDAEWYRAKYNIANEKDPYEDWVDTGAKQGRLPNENILASMAQLGKVGYVDANAVLHPVRDATAIGYQPFLQRSNVTGTNMIDCSETIYVLYGDSAEIVHDGVKASLNTGSDLVFDSGTPSQRFIVRPSDRTTTADTKVKFGDLVSLATTITNFSAECGLWGCKVGKVDPARMRLLFGPGGNTPETFRIKPLSSYSDGDAIPYGVPFQLSTNRPVLHNALFQGDVMSRGASLPSSNGEYVLSFRTDGYVALYKGSETIWVSSTGHSNASVLRIGRRGQLEAATRNGVVYWRSSLITRGTSPYAMAVQNSGQLVMYDKNKTVLWKSNEPDAIVSDGETEEWVASVDDRGLLFTQNMSDPATFIFGGRPTANGCNIKALRDECRGDCVGIVHNPATNEWQQIKMGSTDFKITDTLQDFYIKVPGVESEDPACPVKDTTAFVDPTQFQNYKTGEDFGNVGQCTPQFKTPQFLPSYSALTPPVSNSEQLMTTFHEIENNATASSKRLKRIQTYERLGTTPNLTLEKQQKDSSTLDLQAKTHAWLWIVFALGILFFYYLNNFTDARFMSPAFKFMGLGAMVVILYGTVLLYKKWLG